MIDTKGVIRGGGKGKKIQPKREGVSTRYRENTGRRPFAHRDRGQRPGR